jgi:acyl-CoA reductase-like NAD-dependent aldehyde dehydrogenase
MQIDNLVDRVEAIVSALSSAADEEWVETDVEVLAREFDALLTRLAGCTPKNFDESIKLISLFVGLVETVRDDIELAKKYCRFAAAHLTHLRGHVGAIR